MKIGRLLIFFLVLMALLITFGNRGVVDNYFMSKRLAKLQSQTRDITVENNELKKKIVLLRNDVNYIEMIARNDLGMVKKGDIVYRWAK
ncbi:MAG: septum formation initiator family protein [Deltaproteobacteria bacterium]|nr:septum formation initiator family protein [Deltaproteobacteria bacterium]